MINFSILFFTNFSFYKIVIITGVMTFKESSGIIFTFLFINQHKNFDLRHKFPKNKTSPFLKTFLMSLKRKIKNVNI